MSRPSIEIDAHRVARALALDIDQFRRLMDQGRITVLCESGTGDDLGRYRASFYHGRRRARFIIDGSGYIHKEVSQQQTGVAAAGDDS